MKSNTVPVSNRYQFVIEQALWDLGMPPHLKGFYYLHDAVEIVLDAGANISKMAIYAMLAERYNVKSAVIERSMRHAIQVTFERSASALKSEWFGNFVDLRFDRPTNSVFIAVVAAQIRRRLAAA